MADRLIARARRTASILAPFVAVALVVVHGKRW